jgi:Fe-S-cluster-containing dehydrogenase component/anaerobic selenocysteine-containing dehydrogenase
MTQPMDRRAFLRWVAGAGATGAGFIGPRRPDHWISFVSERPHITPGIWSLFATTCRECPAGCGMHVRCREGRAIKAEGNPDHPVNRGGLCPRGQSAPQGLYDPDRVQRPLRQGGQSVAAAKPVASRGMRHMSQAAQPTDDPPSSQTATDRVTSTTPSGYHPVSWPEAIDGVASALGKAKRLLLVSDLQTGALAEVMRQFREASGLPGEVVFYEAYAHEALRGVNQRLFGRPVVPRYRLQDCDLILSFGTDFLESWISDVEYAWQFGEMHHRPPEYGGEMIYIGPRLSMTAANADQFIQVPVGQEYRAAITILQEAARLKGASIADFGFRMTDSEQGGAADPRLQDIARRFVQAKNSVALAGLAAATGPAAENLAAAAMLLNQVAGRIGQSVDFSQAYALGQTATRAKLEELLAGLAPDDVLIVHNTNPAYSLPHLDKHFTQAGQVIFLGTMMNETARHAQWVLPVHSPLEAWGDYEPWTGVHCLMQPTMAPLHETRHSGDVLLALAERLGRPLERAGQRPRTFHDWLTTRWRQLYDQLSPQADFETFWGSSLQKGCAVAQVTPEPAPTLQKQAPVTEPPAEAHEALHLWLWPSILLFDGRTANRGWMQEIPQPMSTLAWGSSIDISPATARRLAVAPGDMIEVSNDFGRVQAPAYVTGDVADNVAALAFGQGHTGLGEVADNRGANAFRLLASGRPGSLFGAVAIRKTGRRGLLITLSATQDQYGRGIVKWIPRQKLRAMQPSDVEEIIWPLPKGYDPRRDLYPPHEYPNHRWAMVVDLDRCVGCGACTTACYAENNIPVMGPQPLIRNRELTWLRVPPYRHPENALRVGFLVLPCQHCDAAPCEPVCPVFASVHNDQGLNAQVYNRCIGTRYCSNNCPYKVRRFGWFNPHWREPLNVQLNPDVEVRCRGVMEKCTFCIQRILYAERRAKVEGRPLRDGEIQPACVQSCPTKVFVFGDLMQPDSQVSKLFEHPRRYQLLKELNTKPAVIYLKRIEVQPTERA